MGNCMETCAPRQREKEMTPGDRGGGGTEKEGGFKVKVLLTRGELEWLLLQLKEKGERRLEDVLMEIERERRRSGRERAEGWKPSLESIKESPEVQRLDTDP